jgi:TRAP-type C4-dicarboxylate transport system permease small subunit
MAAMQVRTHQKTIILQIPLVILYAILPIMGVLIMVRTIQVVYEDYTEQRAQKQAA